mmetsp:Transcript_115430/g.299193  ORF Transcript_115430/g.299193 Transcript_115430/m.299193 type:complete len:255 (+) Transcript_115430:66-830(+)
MVRVRPGVGIHQYCIDDACSEHRRLHAEGDHFAGLVEGPWVVEQLVLSQHKGNVLRHDSIREAVDLRLWGRPVNLLLTFLLPTVDQRVVLQCPDRRRNDKKHALQARATLDFDLAEQKMEVLLVAGFGDSLEEVVEDLRLVATPSVEREELPCGVGNALDLDLLVERVTSLWCEVYGHEHRVAQGANLQTIVLLLFKHVRLALHLSLWSLHLVSCVVLDVFLLLLPRLDVVLQIVHLLAQIPMGDDLVSKCFWA